jgi:uncharacterized protein (TIGR02246 family)
LPSTDIGLEKEGVMLRASTFLAAQLLALLSSTTALAQSDPQVPKEADRAAQAMVTRFVDSWNRADGAAYGENYWPEAELVNPSGVISHGQAAIVQEHVELWAGIFKGSHISGKVRRIRMLGSTFMMVDFDAELSGVRQLPPGSPADAAGVLHNHLKHIMERRDGAWKVLAAQNTFIALP